ncbi:MAG: DUF1080 domain-containing protein [Planctomycetia bacterium]|nr:DUF1080 domain-containing protein [Planctomycetia bacterium]
MTNNGWNRCGKKWITGVAFGCCFVFAALATLHAGEPVSLFNGKNLDGWSVWVRDRGLNNDPKGVFTVADGMIRVSGEEYGGITTDESFSNYRISLEFKWGDETWGSRKNAAKDSGLLIHSFGKDGQFGGIWMLSVEANIVQGGMGDFWIVGGKEDGICGTCKVRKTKNGMIFDPGKGELVTITENGAGCFRNLYWDENWTDTLDVRGVNDVDTQDGWTKMEVVAEGKTMKVYVNGKFVNEVTDLNRDNGRIQLQSEGAEIFFRNVTIESL